MSQVADGEQDSMVTRGVMLGFLSAVGYSAANLALRGLSGRHSDLGWSVWVTAMKAMPTVVLAVVMLTGRVRARQPLFPVPNAFRNVLLAAIVMQFGGNLGFQLALGRIGLAITVPLVFALIISTGAILGRTYLGDVVSRRTVISMGIMTISIVLLSYAATHGEKPVERDSLSHTGIWLGILAALVSGLSYGLNGVVIRRMGQHTLPVESMLLVYSSVGLVSLGALGIGMMGWSRLEAIQGEEWLMMLTAGICNALAFFSVTHALRLMNITHVNVVNASQNAMCAIAAVMIFDEPVSTALVLGIGFSVAGLLILKRP